MKCPRELSIKIAERETVNQKVVLAILTKRGFHVEVAANGIEAIAALQKNIFDLVLMDVQMPYMDGIEATCKIREELRLTTLPIIAMTAHAMTGDRERCIDAGMNDYASKPVNPSTLVHTIMRYLDATPEPVLPKPQESAVVEAAAIPEVSPLQAIDRGLAARLTDNDTVLFEGMLLLFLQMAPERIEKIQTAVSRDDRAAVEREIRKIRSAAERIAAVSVVESAVRLMGAFEAREQSEIQQSLMALESQISRLSRHASDSAKAPSSESQIKASELGST
ncbi:MAG: response regulator [Acidobacteria bacterium]|nr:response regulator [Acidobacteriota bacterium]